MTGYKWKAFFGRKEKSEYWVRELLFIKEDLSMENATSLSSARTTIGRLTGGILKWLLAGVLAFVIVNLMTFIYNRPVGWIDRSNSATEYIWNPNRTIIHANEGFGIYQSDDNGYLNAGDLIEKNYILILGASHTQGKEIMYGKRFSDLLNEKYRNLGIIKSDELLAYNLGADGHYLPSIVSGFSATVNEFPNSRAIVIEIGAVDFDIEELNEAVNHSREFDSKETGKNIVKTLSLSKKVSMTIKEWCPIIMQLKSQKALLDEAGDLASPNDGMADSIHNNKEYGEALSGALRFMRSKFDGEIFIVYHPTVKIECGVFSVEKSEAIEFFADICVSNEVHFIDMTDRFIREYNDGYIVPYGFWNTEMGEGHLNAEGHRMIAEELWEAFQEAGVR